MTFENNMLYKLGVLLLVVVATNFTHASESGIDHAARGKVVNAIASQLEAEYVFPDVGNKMAATLNLVGLIFPKK